MFNKEKVLRECHLCGKAIPFILIAALLIFVLATTGILDRFL